MNTTELTERLRAADDLEVEHVDALIAGAIAQGRRRRVRRRALPALVGVIALVTAVGLAGILAVRDGRSSSPAATAAQVATASTTPATTTATDTARPSTDPNELRSSDVVAVLENYLPAGTTADEIDQSDDPETAEFSKREASAVVVLKDPGGQARAEAGLSSPEGPPGNGCTRQGHCRRIRVDGKTLYEYRDWKKDGRLVYYDIHTHYYRPDGLVASFSQHNYVDHGGYITRSTTMVDGEPQVDLPFSEGDVQALLMASEWDALAPRCRPEFDDHGPC